MQEANVEGVDFESSACERLVECLSLHMHVARGQCITGGQFLVVKVVFLEAEYYDSREGLAFGF